MNNISINGHLTADAQIKYIGSKNTPCVSFLIGKNRSFTNERGNIEKKAMFFEVIVYGNYAQKLHPSLKKGSNAFIQGSLNWESWEKDGQKHSKVNIIAQKIYVFQKLETKDTQAQPTYMQNSQDSNNDNTASTSNQIVIDGEEFLQQMNNTQSPQSQN
ncbi:hypothetical protein Hc94105_0230 [Helicobacter cinaedi]|uniref:single-stranded DNA-binding protein n=1 Tax=Helicobacter cinaedi TaxID=213 RepID=UPI001F1C873C|nr:single-stranded DNA-binding protein [Helicobacter cinaedi]BDB66045.1 hypothetical protein Hc94105_0230 [Helicobacter cinaedi]